MPSRHMFLRVTLATLTCILAVTIAGAQAAKFRVLHTFAGGTDGAGPTTPLIFDRSGNLYGTTAGGGSGTGCGSGCGTVFEFVPNSTGWKERVLYNFTSLSYPTGPLALDSKGNIYGIETSGGGEVYQLVRSSSGWTQNILHNFVGGNDGQFPDSGLVADSAGNLYGATEGGGSNNNGTVFQFTPNGDGTWTYKLIHEFDVAADGYFPYGPLTFDAAGNLYGTTLNGGLYGSGTVFKLSLANSIWTATALYNFTLDFGVVQQPDGVVMDAAGNLYGATIYGGEYGIGTLYELTPTAGYWNRTVIHTFSGGSDGAYPFGGLAIDQTGALYGTAGTGGIYGWGTAYKLVRGTHGQWNFAALHSFNSSDGSYPYFGLIVDRLGNLYGIAAGGGADGLGVAFEIIH